MEINRFNLIQAISYARKLKNNELYDELLKIYYRLLEQEKINDNFIIKFTSYCIISDTAKKYLKTVLPHKIYICKNIEIFFIIYNAKKISIIFAQSSKNAHRKVSYCSFFNPTIGDFVM